MEQKRHLSEKRVRTTGLSDGWVTLPENKQLAPENGCNVWNTIVSFWGPAYVQVLICNWLLVSGSGGEKGSFQGIFLGDFMKFEAGLLMAEILHHLGCMKPSPPGMYETL